MQRARVMRATGAAPRAVVATGDTRPLAEDLREAGIVVVARTDRAVDAESLCLRYRIDVLLFDAALTADGHVLRRLAQQRPAMAVLVLGSEDALDRGLACLRAGARGFVSAEAEADEIAAAVTATLSGTPVLAAPMMSRLLDELRLIPPAAVGQRPVRSPLTAREWEVFDLMCCDRSTQEMADELFVSIETVRTHVKSVLRKLGVRSRRAAVAHSTHLRGFRGPGVIGSPARS